MNDAVLCKALAICCVLVMVNFTICIAVFWKSHNKIEKIEEEIEQ